ncbi:RHS repeat-associated core domain-containing protein [Chryseobacterium cucumeris]|uniref:RHS repeat-associated core domain-containing protein n=1 Tax=Chryseobacterium TaxID=59732 RepID=UPI0037C10654
MIKKNHYIYQYKDHLGNIRVSFGKNSTGVFEIVDSNDYYPFGMNHLKTGNAYFGQNSFKKYKYNGKELQETGMYDYGARFYMPDIGRWGVVDPLAETSRRFSPYNYAFNNPIRFIDPDGMQAEDKIKIFNDGTIERTKDNNAYDTITNEDESKSIQIARINVSESNPTGDSQIGDAKTENIKTQGHDGEAGSSRYTYLQIQNYDVATQFFEFAASNTKVEFGQDRLGFSDGFSTNIITTNHTANSSSSIAKTIGYVNVSLPGSSSSHFINMATIQERVHSHIPGSEPGPSGFTSFLRNGTWVSELSLPLGDRVKYDNIKNSYQYTPNVGYFRYSNEASVYTGRTKK